MTDASETKTRESAAGRLNRELILQTALAQIDMSGLRALSMRSLADALGVEAMSLTDTCAAGRTSSRGSSTSWCAI